MTRRLALALAILPMVAMGAETGGGVLAQTWPGENGWQVALSRLPTEGLQCVMYQETPPPDHILMWMWDNANGLSLAFQDGNLKAANDRNYQEGSLSERGRFVVSIDGKVIEGRGTVRTVLKLPSSGQTVAFMAPVLIAWDHNNPEDGSRPKTHQIFDLLRTGHILRIETYGANYADDLRGVGRALDQFTPCIGRMLEIEDAESKR